MQGKYDRSPICNLYMILDSVLNLKNKQENIPYDKIDNLLELILLNNGCKTESNTIPHVYIGNVIEDEYNLCCVTGMIGNDVNEFYDFFIFNGIKYLVVFIDYFNGIMSSDDIDENDPLYSLKITMGNSVYYDAIKKIVEVFYLTSEPIPGGLLTTAMGAMQRWNQAIIAIHILNWFKPVDENDVSDIPMEDVKKILDGNIKLQLYGIRTM